MRKRILHFVNNVDSLPKFVIAVLIVAFFTFFPTRWGFAADPATQYKLKMVDKKKIKAEKAARKKQYQETYGKRKRPPQKYKYKPTPVDKGRPFPMKGRGIASWYGPGFHGKTTASGRMFNQHSITAAHKTLPFGTKIRVTNRENGKTAIVTINDRGPYTPGRVLDLSMGTFNAISNIREGVIEIDYEVIEIGDGKYYRS